MTYTNYIKDTLVFEPFPSTRVRDLTGQTFGRWTILGFAGVSEPPNRAAYWFCECVCGNVHRVLGNPIVRGESQSCGCWAKELASARRVNEFTYTEQPFSFQLKNIWKLMWVRCTNKSNLAYQWYGAKGVQVCDRWKYFDNFITDMGEPPLPELTLDRYPNKKGNYEPNNCRWATGEQQANNKSNNHVLTYQGKTLTTAQWAKETGIKSPTIRGRIYSGWSVDKALTTPPRKWPSQIRSSSEPI